MFGTIRLPEAESKASSVHRSLMACHKNVPSNQSHSPFSDWHEQCPGIVDNMQGYLPTSADRVWRNATNQKRPGQFAAAECPSTYWPCESFRHSKCRETLVSGPKHSQNMPHVEPQNKSRVLADPTCPANSRSYPGWTDCVARGSFKEGMTLSNRKLRRYSFCKLLSHQVFQRYSINMWKRLHMYQNLWTFPWRTTIHKPQKGRISPKGQHKASQVCSGRQGGHSNPSTPGFPEDPILPRQNGVRSVL